MKTRSGLRILTQIILLSIFTVFFMRCDEDEKEVELEYSQVTDIDGNIYKTVKIGDQWWMAENLKVSRFRDGRLIRETNSVFDSANWTSNPCWCLYDFQTTTPGFLYNFQVVEDTTGVAPEGWHVPTDADWKELETFLGLTSQESNAMNWRGAAEASTLKLTGSKYWVVYGSIWNTNETGFSARAGGCRMFNHRWSEPYGLGFMGFWWSASEQSDTTAWYRHLEYKTSKIFRYYGSKNYGFSIRCVKD